MKRGYTRTSLEEKVKVLLDELGIQYCEQYPTRTGFIIDFAIFYNDKKIAIEVDGPHHDSKEQKRKDRFKDYMLKRDGFLVLRLNWRMFETKKWKDVITNLLCHLIYYER